MSKRSIYIGFLAVGCYFVIAFIPILNGGGTEIFPFFSFKLYSKIPQNFRHYDVLLNGDVTNPQFLIHNNPNLNKLASQYYPALLASKASEYALKKDSAMVRFDQHGYKGQIVILDGDYIRNYQSGELTITFLTE